MMKASLAGSNGSACAGGQARRLRGGDSGGWRHGAVSTARIAKSCRGSTQVLAPHASECSHLRGGERPPPSQAERAVR